MAEHDLIAIFTKDELPKQNELVLIKSLQGNIYEARYYFDERCDENIFYEYLASKQYKPNEIICWYKYI